MFLSENRWKVLLLVVATTAAAEPSRALSLVYNHPHKNVMFIPKIYRRNRKVLFLDEDENRQPFGRGEIDLTQKTYDSKIKFDDAQDYEFTSPEEEKDIPSGNERFYEPQRFRPAFPAYYQGRYSRPYAPTFFDYHAPLPFAPSVRNSLYSTGWKARSPRVVFPYNPDSGNSVQTNSHAGPGFDNVVFREQNFGLNEIGTDEQSLQDIGTGNAGADAFAERGKLCNGTVCCEWKRKVL